MRAMVLLVLVLLGSGCVSARGPVHETGCEIGPTGIFLKVRQYGALTPEDHAVKDHFLDRGGQLYFFRGSYQGENGTGEVDTSDARLHFLDARDVKPQLQRAGFYQPTKDFKVSVAWKLPIQQSDFTRLCGLAGAQFYKLEGPYDDPRVADCGWTEINANTQRGDKTVRAWCEAGPDAFDDMKDGFFSVAEQTRTAANIPS